MSTVLPPPSKRQRTDAAGKARVQQDLEEVPADAGSLRLQFYDETTGLPIGQGPVLVPVADATPKNLELLVNALLGHVSTNFILLLLFCQKERIWQFIGFLWAYSLSFYPSSSRQETHRSHNHCFSHQYIQDIDCSRSGQHRRSAKHICCSPSSFPSTGSVKMRFDDTRSWRGNFGNPILT